MSRLAPVVCALALASALTSFPANAVQRAFVASTGSDANTAANCTFANPCRGFAAALTVLDSGGEIVALDAAGYGAVTITKSVTITGNPGFYAGIAASTGDAVTIATAGVNVTLRGLNINGVGGTNGVNMTNGNRLSIENCVISNFAGTGVTVINTTAVVRIVDSLIRDNASYGVLLENGPIASVSGTKFLGNGFVGLLLRGSTTATLTTGTVSDSTFSGNDIGIAAFAPSAGATARANILRSTFSNSASYGVLTSNGSGTQTISIGYSQVTENAFGLENLASGTLESLGNNLVRLNTTNTAGTITAVPGI